MSQNDALATAAHLHVLLRRKTGRVTDTEWMAGNADYAQAMVRYAREKAKEDGHTELLPLADRLEALVVVPQQLRKSPPPAASPAIAVSAPAPPPARSAARCPRPESTQRASCGRDFSPDALPSVGGTSVPLLVGQEHRDCSPSHRGAGLAAGRGWSKHAP